MDIFFNNVVEDPFLIFGHDPWHIAIAAGCSAFGQLLRGLLGRYKAKRENQAAGIADTLGFERFLWSLGIAAIAGTLMLVFILEPFGADGPFALSSKDKIIALIGVGAAGADFIESFLGIATKRVEKRVQALRG